MPLDMCLALIAVFVQVALTFYAIWATGRARLVSITTDKIKLGDIAISTSAYSTSARQQANNLSNQFEFPILLYVAVAFAGIFNASSMVFALACIGYVITRIWHRLIHVFGNDVRTRFKVFTLGIVLLALVWLLLALGLFGLL